MIGPILVTLLVAVIVGSFITVVNRMLRSDEYWNEAKDLTPSVKAVEPTAPASSWKPAPAHA